MKPLIKRPKRKSKKYFEEESDYYQKEIEEIRVEHNRLESRVSYVEREFQLLLNKIQVYENFVNDIVRKFVHILIKDINV